VSVEEVLVRGSGPEDAGLAPQASALIEEASHEHDIARRSVSFLEEKIRKGRAAFAFDGDELIGFGYWSDWEGGRFVSHSGLVVRPGYTGHGIGRRLKMELFESSRRALPKAKLMSLTTSPQVKAMNLALGFRVVPLDQLTTDPAFWEGCKTCRNYAEVQARGEKCCCEGMLLLPGGGEGGTA
jgi:GNAT superfamily N-acetyltransferase